MVTRPSGGFGEPPQRDSSSLFDMDSEPEARFSAEGCGPSNFVLSNSDGETLAGKDTRVSGTVLLETCQFSLEVTHLLLGCDALIAFLQASGVFFLLVQQVFVSLWVPQAQAVVLKPQFQSQRLARHR